MAIRRGNRVFNQGIERDRTIRNYPEQGQTTVVMVEADPTNIGGKVIVQTIGTPLVPRPDTHIDRDGAANNMNTYELTKITHFIEVAKEVYEAI